jgi:hypothetical protein
LLRIGLRLFKTTELKFGDASSPVKQRRIWIEGEARIGGGERLIRARSAQVTAFQVICQIIGGERDGPVERSEYLCIVIGLGVSPEIKLV